VRTQVNSVELLAQGPSIEVQALSLGASMSVGSGSESWSGPGPADHFLVNRSRGEGIIMEPRSGKSSGSGLVLPGPRTQASTTVFEPKMISGPEKDVEAGWLNGARLLLVEWAPLGSYPIAIQQQSP
jgi:hypothetical protein